MISDKELLKIENRCKASTCGPWIAVPNDRNDDNKPSYIDMANESSDRVRAIVHGATDADRDFIASIRQDIPILIEQIRMLKKIQKNRE